MTAEKVNSMECNEEDAIFPELHGITSEKVEAVRVRHRSARSPDEVSSSITKLSLLLSPVQNYNISNRLQLSPSASDNSVFNIPSSQDFISPKRASSFQNSWLVPHPVAANEEVREDCDMVESTFSAKQHVPSEEISLHASQGERSRKRRNFE